MCCGCTLIADIGASHRDADRGPADWQWPSVERWHAALMFITAILLFDIDHLSHFDFESLRIVVSLVSNMLIERQVRGRR
jgi:hypothetical protein